MEYEDMRRRLLTTLLLLAFLIGAIATVNFPLAAALSRSHEQVPATGDTPHNEVQMDRAFAEVPRTQVSSPFGTILPRVEVTPIAAVRLIAPILTIEQPAAIIKQQHVFRI